MIRRLRWLAAVLPAVTLVAFAGEPEKDSKLPTWKKIVVDKHFVSELCRTARLAMRPRWRSAMCSETRSRASNRHVAGWPRTSLGLCQQLCPEALEMATYDRDVPARFDFGF